MMDKPRHGEPLKHLHIRIPASVYWAFQRYLGDLRCDPDHVGKVVEGKVIRGWMEEALEASGYLQRPVSTSPRG